MRTINGCVVIDENDIGKTHIQILTDLLYESQGLRIPEDKIVYGVPQALDARPDLYYDPNTFIPFKIDITYEDRLTRNGGFMYRRRDFAKYFADTGLVIEAPTFPFWLHDVLDQMNAVLPYPLDSTDVLNYRFEDPTATTIELIAAPGSLLWTGRARAPLMPFNPNFFKLVPLPFLPGFVQYVNP